MSKRQSSAKCLRCGAGSEWLEGKVPDEPSGCVAELAQLKAQLGALYGKIMNLPEEAYFALSSASLYGYEIGHRDARRAAAELVAATAQPGPSDGDSGEVRKL